MISALLSSNTVEEGHAFQWFLPRVNCKCSCKVANDSLPPTKLSETTAFTLDNSQYKTCAYVTYRGGMSPHYVK
jgi:hypothetical protein